MMLQIDMPKDMEEKFRTYLADHGIMAFHYEEVGPAGGNPRWRFVIDDKATANALMDFYFDGKDGL